MGSIKRLAAALVLAAVSVLGMAASAPAQYAGPQPPEIGGVNKPPTVVLGKKVGGKNGGLAVTGADVLGTAILGLGAVGAGFAVRRVSRPRG